MLGTAFRGDAGVRERGFSGDGSALRWKGVCFGLAADDREGRSPVLYRKSESMVVRGSWGVVVGGSWFGMKGREARFRVSSVLSTLRLGPRLASPGHLTA